MDIKKLLGIRTEAEALELGMTHHGRMLGILPCYVSPLHPDTPIEYKWVPLEWIEAPLLFLWTLTWEMYHRFKYGADAAPEPEWALHIGKRIPKE